MSALPPTEPPVPGPWATRFLVGMACLFMLLPHAGRWQATWKPEVFFAVESRHPAPLPDPVRSWQTLVAWTAEWDAYLTDRLAFRQQVLVAGQWLKWKLGLPTVRTVWGKQGWVFMNTFFEVDMPAYLRGTVPWEDNGVDAFLNVMERRQDWLAEQGIPMLTVIAPVKGSVYPEFLPDSIRPLAPTMRQRLLSRMAHNGSQLHLLDLLPPLLAAKSEGPSLYFKTDTHWNEFGARAAYEAIMAELQQRFPELVPIDRQTLQLLPVPCVGLDLGVLSSLSEFMSDTRYDTTPNGKSHIQYILVGEERMDPHPQFGFHLGHLDATLPVGVYTDRGDRPRVLLYRDSYAGSLGYFLNETFREVHYRHHFGMQFDPEPALSLRPDLVIYVFVERALLQFNPGLSTQREQALLSPLP